MAFLFGRSPKRPKIPAPPKLKPPPPPPPPPPVPEDVQIQQKKERERKRILARVGREGTILTSTLGRQDTEKATLLGQTTR